MRLHLCMATLVTLTSADCAALGLLTYRRINCLKSVVQAFISMSWWSSVLCTSMSLMRADEPLHRLCFFIVDGSCCCQVLFYLFCHPVILNNSPGQNVGPWSFMVLWPRQLCVPRLLPCICRDHSVSDGHLYTRCCDHLTHAYFALGVGLALSSALCTPTS